MRLAATALTLFLALSGTASAHDPCGPGPGWDPGGRGGRVERAIARHRARRALRVQRWRERRAERLERRGERLERRRGPAERRGPREA
jgi:hypothetical protein